MIYPTTKMFLERQLAELRAKRKTLDEAIREKEKAIAYIELLQKQEEKEKGK
jgi:prefoldin subunit 5